MFLRKGYAGASFRDLTEAMGIGPPSLCAAFGGKHGLFLAAVDRYAATRSDALIAALEGPGGLAAALERFFRAVVADACAEGEGGAGGCLIACALADAAGEDAALRARLATLIAAIDRRIAETFLAAGLAPEQAVDRARLTTVVMHGLALRARAGASRDDLEAIAQASVLMLDR